MHLLLTSFEDKADLKPNPKKFDIILPYLALAVEKRVTCIAILYPDRDRRPPSKVTGAKGSSLIPTQDTDFQRIARQRDPYQDHWREIEPTILDAPILYTSEIGGGSRFMMLICLMAHD